MFFLEFFYYALEIKEVIRNKRSPFNLCISNLIIRTTDQTAQQIKFKRDNTALKQVFPDESFKHKMAIS